jgi:hypothetical protein
MIFFGIVSMAAGIAAIWQSGVFSHREPVKLLGWI